MLGINDRDNDIHDAVFDDEHQMSVKNILCHQSEGFYTHDLIEKRISDLSKLHSDHSIIVSLSSDSPTPVKLNRWNVVMDNRITLFLLPNEKFLVRYSWEQINRL